MSGFALHPDAFTDLDDIWEFMAADSVAAADRLAADIFETLRGSLLPPTLGTAART